MAMKKNSLSILAVAILAIAITAWALVARSGDQRVAASLSGPSAETLSPVAAPGDLIDAEPRAELQRTAVEDTSSEATNLDVARAQPEHTPPAPGAAAIPAQNEGSVAVTVLDEAGRPLAGAEVHAERVGSRALNRTQSSGTTDEHGLARITNIPLGLVHLWAEAPNMAPGSRDVVKLTAERPGDTVEIVLTTGGSVVGRLRDLNGELASGIRISIHLSAWPGQLDRGHPGVMQGTDTAADGTFRFDHLTPGSYTLYTRAEGERIEHVPEQRVELEVVAGQTTEVQFADSASSYVKLSGIVLCNGEPLTNAGLNLGWADRSRGYLGKSTKTDDSGRFKITLDEGGGYRFQISKRGTVGSVFREISIPSTASHEIGIAFSTGRILGHLFGPDGEPVAGLKLTAYGRSDEPGPGSSVAYAQTDEAGAYEFPNLLCATYKVVAAVNAVSPEPLAAPSYPYMGSAKVSDLELGPGETLAGVDLTLSAAAALEGRVTDAEGSPAGSATVECVPVGTRGGPGSSRWRVEESGEYVAGGLEPGDYRVRAIRQREISAWKTVTARLGASGRADLVLEPGTVVNLEVRADGEPVQGGWVRVVDADGIILDSAILKAGSAQLGPFYPGTYEALASMSGGEERPASQSITVAGERSITVELEMP